MGHRKQYSRSALMMDESTKSKQSDLARVFAKYATHFCTRVNGGCIGMYGETCSDCWNRANFIVNNIPGVR